MEVDKKLYQEIKQYCELNGLKPSEYVNSTLKKAFMEDKYGSAPFLRKDQDLALNGNDAFNDAVNAEVKRILNDEEEMKKFFSEVNRAANEIHSKSARVASFVEVPVGGPDRNGRVYPEEVVKEAVDKFNKTFLDGMKEAQETEKEISDYMEENNLEPVSMDELIYGDDETAFIAQDKGTEVQPPKQVKKRTIKPIK